MAVHRNTLPARRQTPSWRHWTLTSSGFRKASHHPRPCSLFTLLAQKCSSCQGAWRVSPALEALWAHRGPRLNTRSSNISISNSRTDAASVTGKKDGTLFQWGDCFFCRFFRFFRTRGCKKIDATHFFLSSNVFTMSLHKVFIFGYRVYLFKNLNRILFRKEFNNCWCLFFDIV